MKENGVLTVFHTATLKCSLGTENEETLDFLPDSIHDNELLKSLLRIAERYPGFNMEVKMKLPVSYATGDDGAITWVKAKKPLEEQNINFPDILQAYFRLFKENSHGVEQYYGYLDPESEGPLTKTAYKYYSSAIIDPALMSFAITNIHMNDRQWGKMKIKVNYIRDAAKNIAIIYAADESRQKLCQNPDQDDQTARFVSVLKNGTQTYHFDTYHKYWKPEIQDNGSTLIRMIHDSIDSVIISAPERRMIRNDFWNLLNDRTGAFDHMWKTSFNGRTTRASMLVAAARAIAMGDGFAALSACWYGEHYEIGHAISTAMQAPGCIAQLFLEQIVCNNDEQLIKKIEKLSDLAKETEDIEFLYDMLREIDDDKMSSKELRRFSLYTANYLLGANAITLQDEKTADLCAMLGTALKDGQTSFRDLNEVYTLIEKASRQLIALTDRLDHSCDDTEVLFCQLKARYTKQLPDFDDAMAVCSRQRGGSNADL